MTTKSKKKSNHFSVKISDEEHKMLNTLAKDAGVTMSDLLRESILTRFRMRFGNEPKCTNASPCLCPNMHAVQASFPDSNAELLGKVDGNDDSPKN